METNPARRLLVIFERWMSITDQPIETVRALRTIEGIEETSQALYALKEIKDFLDYSERAGSDIRVFREASLSWFRTVFNFGNYWGNPQGDIEKVDLLHGLIPLIDATAPRLNPDSFQIMEVSLNKTVDELLETLKGADDLDEYLREHLTRAVLHVRDCLERFELLGIFDLASAIKDLEILLAAAVAMDTADSSRWERFRDAFRGFTTNPTTAAVAGALVGNGVTALLTQG